MQSAIRAVRPRRLPLGEDSKRMVATHDFICSPLHAHRLHMGIAGSKVILIEKAGHFSFSWLEQPNSFFSQVKEGLAVVQ